MTYERDSERNIITRAAHEVPFTNPVTFRVRLSRHGTRRTIGAVRVECMPVNYDLHTHSSASDGTLSPTELIWLARRQGADVIALTDHDTTAGIEEAALASGRAGIQVVAGVEVSVTWSGRTVHILGLDVDIHRVELQKGLRGLREFRTWRAQEIGRRLEKSGIADALDGARAFAAGQLIGRTHFARFLVARGHCRDERTVFKHFLVNGKPGHVPGAWAELEQAVSWIRAANGFPVIAHPARYRMTRSRLRSLIGEFVEVGGAGLEVVSGSHSRDDCYTMARHARDFRLLASAGSDYHGPENPWIELGRLPGLPDGCRPIWRELAGLQHPAGASNRRATASSGS